MTDEPAQRWLRTYATLALQVNRQVVGTSRGDRPHLPGGRRNGARR